MATDVPEGVRARVYARDGHRCRWCGRANVSVEIHHIEYRSSGGQHVEDNLICLCFRCHKVVHGTIRTQGETLSKEAAQEILRTLIEVRGVTGIQIRRINEREKAKGESDDVGQGGTDTHAPVRPVLRDSPRPGGAAAIGS